jgi:hypothetical protein
MSSNSIEIKECIVPIRSCPLMQMRVFGWKEILRSKKCEVVRDLNGDKAQGKCWCSKEVTRTFGV